MAPPIDVGLEDRQLDDLQGQLNGNSAVLFLGAGTTRNCRLPDGRRGLTGTELAQEIIKDLNNGNDPGFSASLMEVAEWYAAVKPSARGGLDAFILNRLSNLRPTLGHYIAASFPWRAVVTTNYNRVIEDAWGSAHAEGFSSRELVAVRTDDELLKYSGDFSRIRLYKPHGCVTVPDLKEHRMVLTSQDYFVSEQIRSEIFKAVRSAAGLCTTVFVGYSLNDFTFRNIYYTLYRELGEWARRSYSVSPYSEALRLRWTRESMSRIFNTVIANDGFDTFMLRLLRRRGRVHASLLKRIEDSWLDVKSDNGSTMGDLEITQFKSMPAL